MRYQGLLYRALNPVWARDPMSGEGARRYGGRFNPKGIPALYTSLSIMTALREANQIGTLQPTTLVAYHADLHRVFDTGDPDQLRDLGLQATDLAADDWRFRMQQDGKAPTQLLAERLMADGYVGMQVRSYAKGATAEDLNIVLWSWGDDSLRLVDDEQRLVRAQQPLT